MSQPRLPFEHCPICTGTALRRNLSLPWAKIHRAYRMFLGEEPASWVPEDGHLHVLRCLGCDLLFGAGAEEAPPGYYRARSETAQLGFDYYLRSRPGFEVAARRIRPGDRLLDVGCGAEWFADAVPDA